MGHPSRELTDGLDLLRLAQLLLGLAQCLGSPYPLRDVPKDHDDPDDLALIVQNRRAAVLDRTFRAIADAQERVCAHLNRALT